MTRQTTQPIDRLSLTATNRMVRELVHMWQDGTLDLNPPYQRGEVWAEDQQVALIRSFLMGVPIPALVMNERTWAFKFGGAEPLYAMIDGQQRVRAAARWFDGGLAVPASWFPAEDVLATVDTTDGAYVTYNDLCKPARNHFAGEVTRTERYKGWPQYEMKDGRRVQAVMDTLRINGLAQVGTDPPSLTEAGRAALAAARAAAEG